MDSSPEDMRRRIESLELEVGSLVQQRDFQTRRKEKYKRLANTFERESMRWKKRAVSMRKENDRLERVSLDEAHERQRSDESNLQEMIALNNHNQTLRQSYNALSSQLKSTVRRLEGQVEYETQRSATLQYDNGRLRAEIESHQNDKTNLQGRIGEHETAELMHLDQLKEHRNENADLKRELEKMAREEKSVNARIRGLLRESSDREREGAKKLEEYQSKSSEMLAMIQGFWAAEFERELEAHLVEQDRLLAEDGLDWIRLLVASTPSPNDTSTARSADDTNTPRTASGTSTSSLDDASIISLDGSSIPRVADDARTPGELADSSTSRPSSPASRRHSMQADPELAAIDARIEHSYHQPGPQRQANENDEGIILRRLQRMRLPPMPIDIY